MHYLQQKVFQKIILRLKYSRRKLFEEWFKLNKFIYIERKKINLRKILVPKLEKTLNNIRSWCFLFVKWIFHCYFARDINIKHMLYRLIYFSKSKFENIIYITFKLNILILSLNFLYLSMNICYSHPYKSKAYTL